MFRYLNSESWTSRQLYFLPLLLFIISLSPIHYPYFTCPFCCVGTGSQASTTEAGLSLETEPWDVPGLLEMVTASDDARRVLLAQAWQHAVPWSLEHPVLVAGSPSLPGKLLGWGWLAATTFGLGIAGLLCSVSTYIEVTWVSSLCYPHGDETGYICNTDSLHWGTAKSYENDTEKETGM